MYEHSVFGGTLRSEIFFEELGPSRGSPPDWTLTRADSPPLPDTLEPLGEDQVEGEIVVRSFRLQSGFRLDYDDTGTFDVLEGGARIVWSAGATAPLEAVQLDVLGRVLPLALHASGKLSLHGSAVKVRDVGIAFLAPKFYGKSTLAQALLATGARLASDDVVPIEPASATMFPGVPSVRLWSDARARLVPDSVAEAAIAMRKSVAAPPLEEQILREPVSLAAIYLLRPREPRAGEPAATRTRLPPVQATLALLAEAKLAPLLRGSEAAVLLDRVAAVVRTVPVFTLELARGWEHLPAVVEELLEWHAAAYADAPAPEPSTA